MKSFKKTHIFLIGLCIVALGWIPYFLLKEGSVFTYYDQLDGEIFSYIFHGKYLFAGMGDGQLGISNAAYYQELMNGIPAEGLQMAAPFLVIFFFLFSPFWALVCSQMLVTAGAYISMFLCMDSLLKEEEQKPLTGWIVCGVAIIFSYIPHYPVYGLCVAGVPLVVHGMLQLYQAADKKVIMISLLEIIFFGLCSSLILAGYAVLAMMALWIVVLLWKKKPKRVLLQSLFGLISLLAAYLVTNANIVLQIFGRGSGKYTSHKEDLVVYGQSFTAGFRDIFTNGLTQAASIHKVIILPIFLVLGAGFLLRGRLTKQGQKIHLLLIVGCVANICIAAFHGFWKWEPITAWRNEIGGVIKYFQADRFYWLSPAIWYICLGLALYLLCYGWEIKLQPVFIGIALMIAGISGLSVCNQSTFKMNVRQLKNPDTSYHITWEKFYAQDLYEEVAAYIGEPQDSYRVMSLGIYPAAALYNGFYCLDGYSNNYDIVYKKEFREIIAGELDKSEGLRIYYDNWGNRCYLFSSEIGQYYMLAKGSGFVVEDLSIDTGKAKEMGCRYIFSGAKIENADALSLKEEQYFETETGHYGIYLYSLR